MRSKDKEFKELYINEFESVTQAEINELLTRCVYLTREFKGGFRGPAYDEYKQIYHILAGHLGADLENQIEMMTKTIDMIDPIEPINFQYNGEYRVRDPKPIMKMRNTT